MDIGTVGLIGAFAAGGLSFLSPCVFPLIPAYLAQLTGMSMDELTGKQTNSQRIRLISNAVAFVIGLALVFTFLGASATLVGGIISSNQRIIGRAAGLIIVIFGLHLLGIVKIPWLMREARTDLVKARQTSKGIWGSFVMGGAFGVGWTPCIGPILASILVIAGQAETIWVGMSLLALYALGLGVPFIIMAFLLNLSLGKNLLGTIRRYMPQLNAGSGILLIAMGLLVFTGNLIMLSNWITQTFGTGLTV